jgi:hypothetical protein
VIIILYDSEVSSKLGAIQTPCERGYPHDVWV